MTVNFYRCAADAEHAGLNRPPSSRRPPGNVPYVIDNIWEWLRPASMPNRRHAVFASPTPALAVQAAGGTAGLVTKRVGAVELAGPGALAQIPNSDARFHRDVNLVRRDLLDFLGGEWLDAPIERKQKVGCLFMPLLTAEEVQHVLTSVPQLEQKLRASSTFWADAQSFQPGDALPYPDGEIFFQTSDGYWLRPLNGSLS